LIVHDSASSRFAGTLLFECGDEARSVFSMISLSRCNLFCTIVCCCLAAAADANAHPHVWVTLKSELVYVPDGSVTGVRHSWTFDDMYTAFALQGVKGKKKGEFTREELRALAKENVTSLKEYNYFTFAKAEDKKVDLEDPVDYYLDYDSKEAVLTLHFTLPFKAPVKTKQLHVDIYDPDYFIEFAFTKNKPVALVGAPTTCKFSIVRPETLAAQGPLPESFFASLTAANWGAQFANKITVKCP
jgi:ABC-type uncharacterized transport system substrate-binding protein